MDRPTMRNNCLNRKYVKILDQWDPLNSSRQLLNIDSNEPGRIWQEHQKGWKFAVSKLGLTKNVNFWHTEFVDSSYPKLPTLSLGICTLPIDEDVHTRGIYNCQSVWVYTAHNGMCYHRGKSTKLDTFTVGDIVTLKLDLTNRKLLVSLNGGLFREGFSCLPRNETFYAFCSLSDSKGNRTDEIRIVRYPR
jgi:hypothetical protein